MPATTRKQVDPSHTIEYQRTVINDIAGDLHSIFTGTAAINAATIQIAGGDLGTISDHLDKTIFFYYGAFDEDYTIEGPSKIGEVYSHEDAFVDIADGVTVTVDENCVLSITNTTDYKFFSNDSEQTNPQKLTGFADNIKTSIDADTSLTGSVKVGYCITPKHLEAPPLQQFTPTAGTFDKDTGVMVLTIGSHTLKVGDNVKIDQESLSFTCGKDNNATVHKYPRAIIYGTGKSDPSYNKNIAITAVTDTTITINTGIATSLPNFDVSAADYNINNGQLTLTIGDHTLTTSDYVSLKEESLTFTCAHDNHITEHKYPRATDPAANKLLKIVSYNTAQKTITIDVGLADLNSGRTVHNFIIADKGAVKYGDHTFVSASNNAISSGGEKSDDVTIDIDDTFTMTVDEGAVLIV